MPTSRLGSMREAVSLIEAGDSVAMGLALEHAIPFAVGHELIRRGTGDLTLVGPISDALFDQLVGAGLVARIRAAWVGNVSTGLGYRFREAVESGTLEVEDHSNFSIALGLQAATMGVPYLPTRSLLGSDILRESDALVEAEDPFGGGPLVLVPAIEPDWAVVHVQRASPLGDAQLWGNTGVVGPAVGAARRVLITAEEVVDPEVIRADPDRVGVTRERVAAVVACPFGAHPAPVAGCYERDNTWFLDYAERTRTRDGFARWADEWVHGVEGRAEYAARLEPGRLATLERAARGEAAGG